MKIYKKMSDLNFKIAYEVVMMELCDLAQQAGKTVDDVKSFVLANPEIIADRIKEIIK